MKRQKCGCWKGYKRVPGTKPCSNNSCMKVSEESKPEPKPKSSAAKRLEIKRKK